MPPPPPRGVLLVLSGPSGSGKTTLARRVVAAAPEARFSVSATTRPPRPGERDGVDYHFWTEERFQEGLARGELLESAQVYGRYHYGTPRSFVERELAAGRDVLLDIDVQGGLQVKRRFPAARLVFILPGGLAHGPAAAEAWKATLRRRLAARGTESPEEIERRLGFMEQELKEREQYDEVVVNDDLEQAVAELEAIRRAARAAAAAAS